MLMGCFTCLLFKSIEIIDCFNSFSTSALGIPKAKGYLLISEDRLISYDLFSLKMVE